MVFTQMKPQLFFTRNNKDEIFSLLQINLNLINNISTKGQINMNPTKYVFIQFTLKYDPIDDNFVGNKKNTIESLKNFFRRL